MDDVAAHETQGKVGSKTQRVFVFMTGRAKPQQAKSMKKKCTEGKGAM
jgi:hypothetical protein